MRVKDVKVPAGVEVRQEGNVIYVKGPKGEVSKRIKEWFELKVENGKVNVKTERPEMINTILAHLENMIKGVTQGYERRMIIRYAHFPINVEVRGKEVIIKNFLGERAPRKAKIHGDAKVEVKGQYLIISGLSKEDVGQTVANIRQATKIKNKDPRVFQDGIYPVLEEGG